MVLFSFKASVAVSLKQSYYLEHMLRDFRSYQQLVLYFRRVSFFCPSVIVFCIPCPNVLQFWSVIL